MNLEETIETLERHYILRLFVDRAKLDEAAMRGIEALQRIRHNRLVNNHPDHALLPGETE